MNAFWFLVLLFCVGLAGYVMGHFVGYGKGRRDEAEEWTYDERVKRL